MLFSEVAVREILTQVRTRIKELEGVRSFELTIILLSLYNADLQQER